MVPRSAACTVPEATGAAFVITGGHALAHAPSQLDFPSLSATHRYNARPVGPVKYLPFAPVAALIATPEADALDALEVVDGFAAAELTVDVELLELPQAATHNAAPTATAAATLLARNFARLAVTIFLLPVRGVIATLEPAGRSGYNQRHPAPADPSHPADCRRRCSGRPSSIWVLPEWIKEVGAQFLDRFEKRTTPGIRRPNAFSSGPVHGGMLLGDRPMQHRTGSTSTARAGDWDRASLLAKLEEYLDSAPRVACSVERIGPFSLFVGSGPWSYYARPAPGHGGDVRIVDVTAVTARQRELSQPEAFEWVCELAPGLAGAARAAGLEVRIRPLMALTSPPEQTDVTGVRARVLGADDEQLAAAIAAVDVGFGRPGTDVGPESTGRRDLEATAIGGRVAFTRDLIRSGDLVFAAAEGPSGPIAGGSALPLGDVAELAGIATLPAWRRRGIGALVAATLASSARARGVRVATLSATDDAVARVYARAGFDQIGTAGEARRPAGDTRSASPAEPSGR